MLQDPITDLKEAKSLIFRRDYIDIFQISWGPDDGGKTFNGPGRGTRPSLPRLTAEKEELELGWQMQASQLTVALYMMGQLHVHP